MRFVFCLLWLQVIPLLLALTFIATADAQLTGNTTRAKMFQCIRVTNLIDRNYTVLSGNQPEDFKVCAGIDRPPLPSDLTELFVHWECRALKKGVRTVPQFVFKLMVTKKNSTRNKSWKKLKNSCGCKRTLYSIRYLSEEISSHNKWHFSEMKIPVGMSCGNWDTAQCNNTIIEVKKEWSWVCCKTVNVTLNAIEYSGYYRNQSRSETRFRYLKNDGIHCRCGSVVCVAGDI